MRKESTKLAELFVKSGVISLVRNPYYKIKNYHCLKLGMTCCKRIFEIEMLEVCHFHDSYSCLPKRISRSLYEMQSYKTSALERMF